MMQAVLLAGGRGTRLAPLTDTKPKALVDVAGQPFLSHLTSSLRDQGVANLLILAGYRADQLVQAAQMLSAGTIALSTVAGDEEWSTGERLWHAREHLDPEFLLLYSDNMAGFNLDRLRHRFEGGDFDVVLSLGAKSPGNVSRMEGEPARYRYWARNRRPDAPWVELGFALVRRDALLQELADTNRDLPDALQALSARRRVSADEVHGPYLSISDVHRLEAAETLLRQQRVVFLDRDGVLNERSPRGTYITSPEKLKIIPRNIQALGALAEAGATFIVISNQAGVARGVMTLSQVDEVNEALSERLREAGVALERIYTCPHGWDDGCACRKPRPGMLQAAADEFGIFLPRAIFVGDDIRDVEAGNAASTQTLFISDPDNPEFGQSQYRPTMGTFMDLVDATQTIQRHFEEFSS
jgi:histidinol-phosphate phosphatase family protein